MNNFIYFLFLNIKLPSFFSSIAHLQSFQHSKLIKMHPKLGFNTNRHYSYYTIWGAQREFWKLHPETRGANTVFFQASLKRSQIPLPYWTWLQAPFFSKKLDKRDLLSQRLPERSLPLLRVKSRKVPLPGILKSSYFCRLSCNPCKYL